MKNRILKRFTAVLLIAVMAACLYGCSRYTEKDVLKHLEKKYDEEFTFIDYPGAGNDSLMITVSCDSFPDEELTARVTPDGVYSDNYMGFYWRPQLEQAVEDSVNSALSSEDSALSSEDSCKTYASISGATLQGDETDKTSDPAEYFSAGNSSFILTIFINEAAVEGMSNEDIAEAIRSALQSAGVNADGSIVTVKADSWDDITRSDGEYTDMKSGKFGKNCLYILDQQYQFTNENWE